MPKNHSLSSIIRSELGSRIITVLAVISVLVIAILLSGPKPAEFTEQTASEPQIALSQNLSPMSNQANADEPKYPVTYGIIVGVSAIMVIIFTGTLLELRRNF